MLSVPNPSFTGSVPTGKKIALAAIKNMARVQCEMGSKNPIVIDRNFIVTSGNTTVTSGNFIVNGGS